MWWLNPRLNATNHFLILPLKPSTRKIKTPSWTLTSLWRRSFWKARFTLNFTATSRTLGCRTTSDPWNQFSLWISFWVESTGTWSLKVSCTTSSKASTSNRSCPFCRYVDAKSLIILFWWLSFAGHISSHEPCLDRSIQPADSEHNYNNWSSFRGEVSWYKIKCLHGSSPDTHRVHTFDTIWLNYWCQSLQSAC